MSGLYPQGWQALVGVVIVLIANSAYLPCEARADVGKLPQSVEPDLWIDLWDDPAPGESTRNTGEVLPQRANENPPATRIKSITRPRLAIYQPPVNRRNGVAVILFPGGAYNYVVVDKEGSEVARNLNQLGVTACVLHYRTKGGGQGADSPVWSRPLQDGQRAVRLLRARADQWGIDPEKIGVAGFSAGGQAAALVATRFADESYASRDAIDEQSSRPDFALLIYPWRLYDESTGKLMEALTLSAETPPTFLVHTHDDRATSLSSALFYVELRRLGVPAELHIYQNGGHGYGLRPVAGSNVHTWPQRARDWLQARGLAK